MTTSPNSSDVSSTAHPAPSVTPHQAPATDDVQTTIADLVRRSQELRDAAERLARDVEKLRLSTLGGQAQTMSASPSPLATDEIAAIAKQLWEQEGKPDGKSHEHWFRAEAMLHQRQIATAAGNTSTPNPPAAVGLS